MGMVGDQRGCRRPGDTAQSPAGAAAGRRLRAYTCAGAVH